jgi:glycosyltransferase involved in cell wall biosynthesis
LRAGTTVEAGKGGLLHNDALKSEGRPAVTLNLLPTVKQFSALEDHPLVSIVTPSYNMVRFVEEAIQSVLSQDYSSIEYLVVDGGSTDGTLEILRKYEGRLRYISEPDLGQTDAINKGFRLSHGSVFAFLCADDIYLPGAVSTAVRHLVANPSHAGIYGEGYLIDENGTNLGRYPTREFDPELLKRECFICQPAAFLRHDAFVEAGMMNVNQHCGLDYDLWIRVAKRTTLLKVDDYLAGSRMHSKAKTLSQRAAVFKASIDLLKYHYGYAPFSHVYGYCCALVDRRDGFFEPVPPSLFKYGLALIYGSLRNPRHLRRYWKEWLEQGSPRLSAKWKGASSAIPGPPTRRG